MPKYQKAETPEPEPKVYYCPRSCHEGRTYPSLEDVIIHVELQHPDHDPFWWDT